MTINMIVVIMMMATPNPDAVRGMEKLLEESAACLDDGGKLQQTGSGSHILDCVLLGMGYSDCHNDINGIMSLIATITFVLPLLS